MRKVLVKPWRALALLVAAATVTGLLVAAQAGASDPAQYSASIGPTIAAGSATPTTLTITFTNNSADPVTAPITFTAPVGWAVSIANPSVTVDPGDDCGSEGSSESWLSSTDGRTVTLEPESLGSDSDDASGQVDCDDWLPTGSTLTATVSATVGCGAGNGWTVSTGSTDVTLPTVSLCQLAFVHEPNYAKVNKTVTDAAYDTSADNVAVQAEDGNGNALTGAFLAAATGTVTLNPSVGSFAGRTASFDSNGVATFTGLQGTSPTPDGQSVTLGTSFSSAFTDATSSPFAITLDGEGCSDAGCSALDTPLSSNTQVTSTASGSVFQFLGIDSTSIPSTIPAGCANFHSLGAAAVNEVDGRSGPGGSLTFVYAISNSLVKKSPNNGNAHMPICAGTERLDSGGKPVRCDAANGAGGPGWVDDTLTSNGDYSGKQSTAVCDSSTGMWWGILGNFNDPIDASQNPTITSWSGGSKGRYFTITVPYPWDIKWGG